MTEVKHNNSATRDWQLHVNLAMVEKAKSEATIFGSIDSTNYYLTRFLALTDNRIYSRFDSGLDELQFLAIIPVDQDEQSLYIDRKISAEVIVIFMTGKELEIFEEDSFCFARHGDKIRFMTDFEPLNNYWFVKGFVRPADYWFSKGPVEPLTPGDIAFDKACEEATDDIDHNDPRLCEKVGHDFEEQCDEENGPTGLVYCNRCGKEM